MKQDIIQHDNFIMERKRVHICDPLQQKVNSCQILRYGVIAISLKMPLLPLKPCYLKTVLQNLIFLMDFSKS